MATQVKVIAFHFRTFCVLFERLVPAGRCVLLNVKPNVCGTDVVNSKCVYSSGISGKYGVRFPPRNWDECTLRPLGSWCKRNGVFVGRSATESEASDYLEGETSSPRMNPRAPLLRGTAVAAQLIAITKTLPRTKTPAHAHRHRESAVTRSQTKCQQKHAHGHGPGRTKRRRRRCSGVPNKMQTHLHASSWPPRKQRSRCATQRCGGRSTTQQQQQQQQHASIWCWSLLGVSAQLLRTTHSRRAGSRLSLPLCLQSGGSALGRLRSPPQQRDRPSRHFILTLHYSTIQ